MMKVKVISTQHSEGKLYLVGSFRHVEDSIGRELIKAGLAVEVNEKEKVEVEPEAKKEKVEIKIIPKEKNK